LISFLREEVETEIKSRRGGDLPKKVGAFEVKTNKADVKLTRTFGEES